MRLTAWGMIGLVTLALLLIAVVVLGTAAPASCADADDSRKRDILGEAEKAYSAILADEPGSECARRGMVLALRRRCTLAAATKQAGRRDDAEKMLVAALAVEPSILLDAPKDAESQEHVNVRAAARKCLVDALAGIAAEKQESADEENGNATAACPCAPCAATCDDAEKPDDTKPADSNRGKGKPDPTPDPTETPDSTETPEPTVTPDSTETPEPTVTPDSTQTPGPTETPGPTATPKPTPHRTPSADCSATRC